MRKDFTTRIGGFGVHTVMPKIAIAPRRALQRRLDERENDTSPDDQARPPPGMGAMVDKSA
jgi:hypothetical protein